MNYHFLKIGNVVKRLLQQLLLSHRNQNWLLRCLSLGCWMLRLGKGAFYFLIKRQSLNFYRITDTPLKCDPLCLPHLLTSEVRLLWLCFRGRTHREAMFFWRQRWPFTTEKLSFQWSQTASTVALPSPLKQLRARLTPPVLGWPFNWCFWVV